MSIIIMVFLLILISIALSIILTSINLVGFIKSFSNKTSVENFIYSKNIDFTTIVLGSILTSILWSAFDYREHYEAIQIGVDWSMLHAPINEEYLVSVLIPIVLGYAAYFILRLYRDKLSPILLASSISLIFISNAISMMIVLQFSKHFFVNAYGDTISLSYEMFFALPPINFFLLSYMLLKNVVLEYSSSDYNYSNRLLNTLNTILVKGQHVVGLSMVLLIPLYAIIIFILTIFWTKTG